MFLAETSRILAQKGRKVTLSSKWEVVETVVKFKHCEKQQEVSVLWEQTLQALMAVLEVKEVGPLQFQFEGSELNLYNPDHCIGLL